MKKIIAVLLALTMMFSALSITAFAGEAASDFGEYSADNPLVLKLAHNGKTDEDAQAVVTKLFGQYLDEYTNGAVKLDVYGAGILGTDREMLEGAMMGTTDIAISTTSAMASFEPEIEVLDMLYVLNSWDALQKFVQSDIAVELGQAFEPNGVVSIGFYAVGFRSTGSNGKPIASPDDIKGLKIRVIGSDVMMNGFKAFGANPVNLASNEVTPGMEQGTIDAFETVESVFYTQNYECMEYVSMTKHTAMFNSININVGKLNSLTPDLQQMIRNAASAACLEYTKEAEKTTEECLKKLEEKGVVVYYDDQVDTDAFRELYQPILDETLASGKFKYLEDILALND